MEDKINVEDVEIEVLRNFVHTIEGLEDALGGTDLNFNDRAYFDDYVKLVKCEITIGMLSSLKAVGSEPRMTEDNISFVSGLTGEEVKDLLSKSKKKGGKEIRSAAKILWDLIGLRWSLARNLVYAEEETEYGTHRYYKKRWGLPTRKEKEAGPTKIYNLPFPPVLGSHQDELGLSEEEKRELENFESEIGHLVIYEISKLGKEFPGFIKYFTEGSAMFAEEIPIIYGRFLEVVRKRVPDKISFFGTENEMAEAFKGARDVIEKINAEELAKASKAVRKGGE